MQRTNKFIDNIFENVPDNEKYAIITDRDEKITYIDLYKRVTKISTYLQKNSVALLVMNNDLGAVVLYLASLMAGVVPIIVDKSVTKSEILQYINNYSPEYLFVPCEGSVGEKTGNEYGYHPKQTVYRHCICSTRNVGESKKISSSLAFLLPTSGTTHISKLVRISYENVYDNTVNICTTLHIRSGDIAITSLPLSYTYGLSVLNTHLIMHGTILLTDRSVIQKSFWNFANRYGTTSFAGVPYTYELLEKSGHSRKENTIQVYTQAGGKLPIRLQKTFAKYCKDNDKKFYIMYGQTEATARISVLQPDFIFEKCGSAGQVIQGGAIHIHKENGLAKEGEIVYKGKNVCMGYCSCIDDLIKADENKGVLYTGDIGYLDEDGFLFITGRKSGFIKKYGRRISLSGLESMLEESYNIEAIVRGENSVLVILLEEKDSKSIDKLKVELPKQLHLKETDISFQITKQFERTYNGKIQRGKYEKYI